MNTNLSFALELCEVFTEEIGLPGQKKPETTEGVKILCGLLLLYCINHAGAKKKDHYLHFPLCV